MKIEYSKDITITLQNHLTRSIIEELLSAMYALLSILCFANDFTVWGWIFAINAALDVTAAVYFAYIEAREEARARP